MEWTIYDQTTKSGYTIYVTVAPAADGTDPLSDADLAAVVSLLQSRGVLSSTGLICTHQSSPTTWTP